MLKQLSTKLGVSENAIRMLAKRQGIDLTTEDAAIKVAEAFAKPNPNRSPETVQAALQIINITHTTQVEHTTHAEQITPHAEPQQAPEENTQNQGVKRLVLYPVFLAVLIWQIHHTAFLEHSVSVFDGAWSVALAVIFAVGVQFTALFLTIYYARRRFLVGAALGEFAINLLVYFPEKTLAIILLSAISAFTIYSYSELFIKNGLN